MKSQYKFLLVIVLFTMLMFHGCYNTNITRTGMTSSINIGDYVFCVEEATGDRYNIRALYSLKRKDGADIAPETRFESIVTSGGSQNFGGTTTYTLSEDSKTIWIEEVRSSSQKLDSNNIYTVSLENLTFGEDDALGHMEGKWSVNYRIQMNEDYTELLANELKIQMIDDDNYYLLSSIQISAMGIHMEMQIQENDINDLADHCKAHLLLKDGSIIELELHHSISGKESPFCATAEAVFQKSIKLDELYALIVCGHEVCIRNQ